MQRDRFVLHRVVPHRDDVERFVDKTLVREIVPAVNAEPGADAERARGAHVLGLWGTWLDQRGDEHEVRGGRADELLDLRMMGNRAIERGEHPAEQSPSPWRVHAGSLQYRQDERWRVPFGPHPKLRSILEFRTEIP